MESWKVCWNLEHLRRAMSSMPGWLPEIGDQHKGQIYWYNSVVYPNFANIQDLSELLNQLIWPWASISMHLSYAQSIIYTISNSSAESRIGHALLPHRNPYGAQYNRRLFGRTEEKEQVKTTLIEKEALSSSSSLPFIRCTSNLYRWIFSTLASLAIGSLVTKCSKIPNVCWTVLLLHSGVKDLINVPKKKRTNERTNARTHTRTYSTYIWVEKDEGKADIPLRQLRWWWVHCNSVLFACPHRVTSRNSAVCTSIDWQFSKRFGIYLFRGRRNDVAVVCCHCCFFPTEWTRMHAHPQFVRPASINVSSVSVYACHRHVRVYVIWMPTRSGLGSAIFYASYALFVFAYGSCTHTDSRAAIHKHTKQKGI